MDRKAFSFFLASSSMQEEEEEEEDEEEVDEEEVDKESGSAEAGVAEIIMCERWLAAAVKLPPTLSAATDAAAAATACPKPMMIVA